MDSNSYPISSLCKEFPLNVWSWDTRTHERPKSHLANCYLCRSVSEPSEFAAASTSFSMTFRAAPALRCPPCLSPTRNGLHHCQLWWTLIPRQSTKVFYLEKKELLRERDGGRDKNKEGKLTRLTEERSYWITMCDFWRRRMWLVSCGFLPSS